MTQALWLIGVLAFLGFLFLIEKRIRERLALSPESSRKFIHAGIGVVTATFPFYFTDNWPVFLLMIFSIGSLLYVRLYQKDSLGAALHRVSRLSIGEFVYPVGIYICWSLSYQQPLFYSISILVLTFADAFAALIGVKYGRIKYSTKDGFKSWEGSSAFFITAFLCVHIPLLIFSNVGRIECILISIMIAFIIMLLEAFSWRGLDNLFIPITTLFLLIRYQDLTPKDLLFKLVVLLIILFFVYLLRKKSSLNDACLIAAALVIYLSFVLGGGAWALAPAIVFISYQWCFPTVVKDSHNDHDIVLLLYIAVPGLLWLVLHQIAPSEKYFYAFVLCFASELVCLGFSRIIYLNEKIKGAYAAFRAGKISLFLFLPYFLILPNAVALLLFVTSFVAGFLLHVLYGEMKQDPVTTKRFLLQTLVCFGLSSLGLLFK